MGEGRDDPRAATAAAFAAARASGDAEAMAAAALAMAAQTQFGPPPGRTPALLFEALDAVREARTRVRLLAALARIWVYGNDAVRAVPFADEAVALAEQLDDNALVADALDAQLAARWGPDDFAERLHITARLQDVAAHLGDPDARLRAHLWRLTTALEHLDVIGIQRQLAALDLLAAETQEPTVQFFATSRRAMHALLVDDVAAAERLLPDIAQHAAAADAADGEAIARSLSAGIALQRHDVDALRREAELFEQHGVSHGIPSIAAEGAVLRLECGDVDGAARMIAWFDLQALPRDVDWVLTTTMVCAAAAGVGDVDTARACLSLLTPYAGRAVVNAGAVTFHGVVEDYLARAAGLLGDDSAVDLRARAADAYRRLGASWWLQRIERDEPSVPAPRRPRERMHLHPAAAGGEWVVGVQAAVVPDMKGLHYLHVLVGRPGTDVPAADLVAIAAGHPPVPAADAGERLDRRALASYRQRLRDLDEDLDEARSWADDGRVARLEHERDLLLAELRGATGLGGRPRHDASTDERARVSVRKAIAAALDRLDRVEPATARILRRSVRTGAACAYAPDPDDAVEWQLQALSRSLDD